MLKDEIINMSKDAMSPILNTISNTMVYELFFYVLAALFLVFRGFYTIDAVMGGVDWGFADLLLIMCIVFNITSMVLELVSIIYYYKLRMVKKSRILNQFLVCLMVGRITGFIIKFYPLIMGFGSTFEDFERFFMKSGSFFIITSGVCQIIAYFMLKKLLVSRIDPTFIDLISRLKSAIFILLITNACRVIAGIILFPMENMIFIFTMPFVFLGSLIGNIVLISTYRQYHYKNTVEIEFK